MKNIDTAPKSAFLLGFGGIWPSLISILSMILMFHGDMVSLYQTWSSQEEYSHGFLIPFLSVFLIYQQRQRLEVHSFPGSWIGLSVVVFAVTLHFVGRLAVVSTMGQYAFVICIAGLFLALMGWRAFKVIWVAMFMLVFMVKLPTFLFNNLSSELQLISSQVGVWFIRLFDISVYLEGNVIDLGAMKLQVVEACSGLRYLFPLMTLSLMLAILYKAPWWRKVLVFISSIPITVLMNSIRIGAIGVTVEYWGKEMAEGFLHDFEGWVVFMAAFFALFLEIMILNKLVGERRPFSEVLSLEVPASSASRPSYNFKSVPVQFYLAILVIVSAAFVGQSMTVGETVFPKREKLDQFPAYLDGRLASRSYLELVYLNELQVDDYYVADYKSSNLKPINLYIAYYDIQAEGAGTIHSPRSCLPGSGWQIEKIEKKPVSGIEMSGRVLEVNRALISKGSKKVVVYYWMQQRGRIINNEFMAKWWIFWDRLTKGRSDGALVRIMLEVDSVADLENADHQLQQFTAELTGHLPRFIPD